jgi:putative transposase
MAFDPEIHHRRSVRMPAFDYAGSSYYAVTICTQDKACLFGDVVDWKMRLNDVGEMINENWLALRHRFSFVKLDEYIIMPNHLHGIIGFVGAGLAPPACNTTIPGEGVDAGDPRVAPTRKIVLGEVIGAFKSITTIAINRLFGDVGQKIWQRNYYEHVIRNEHDLMTHHDYIVNNPARWQLDEYNPSNWKRA